MQAFKSLGAGASRQEPDDYQTRVVKYIPVEIVAAFIAVESVINSTAQLSAAAHWLIFFALFALTPLYMWRVTSEKNKPPAKTQILVSMLSFFIWVFALGGPFSSLNWYQPVYGALLLPIFTVAIPVINGK